MFPLHLLYYKNMLLIRQPLFLLMMFFIISISALPMNGNVPNSPVIQDVNWSELEDIISLDYHSEQDNHNKVARSPSKESNQPLLPVEKVKKRRRRLFSPDEVVLLTPTEKAERRKVIKKVRRRELRKEQKLNDPIGYAKKLENQRVNLQKKKLELSEKERIELKEKSKIFQREYRKRTKSQIGYTTKYNQQIQQIKHLARNGKATEEQLKISNESSNQRIHTLESDLSELQYRFEEQTAEKRVLLKELSEAKSSLEVAGRQRETRDATIDKLKEEVRALKAELSEAHGALAGSQIPEVAAMEQLRQEKEAAEAARRKAEKNAADQESMLGYARQQMDDARSRAIELQEQNNDFESRFAVLERQATGEISKARSLFLDERAKMETAENLRLKQEVRNLQQLLQRKEEELKSRRSGMGTRAGSVPRSPRVGPASRAGSPIPDRRIGALKNNMM